MSKVLELWQNWRNFWFSPKNLFSVSLFRFVCAGAMFVMYSIRVFDIKTFFYNSGLVPSELIEKVVPHFMRSPLPLYFASDSFNMAFHIVFLVLLVLLAVGLLDRRTTWIVYLLHLSFIQRNPTIIYGADLISTCWLFYLSFIDHSRYFSVKNLWRKAEKTFHTSDILSSTFIRLIQVQLCVVYAYTGMEKLKGTTWWDGSAVWYVMGNENIVPFDLSFFFNFPWLIALMTFSTLLFEIYFPLAVWQRPLRKSWLTLGLALHGLAAVFMGLYYFSILILIAYVLFINSEKLQSWIRRIVPFGTAKKFVG